jgi:hypothetical protein
MKLGFICPQAELQGDPAAVRRIALAAAGMGFDHLLTYKHVVGASHNCEPKSEWPYAEKALKVARGSHGGRSFK